MRNQDINSRFEDWLLSPNETLDFEVKKWLDMADQESQGTVAKALIALENHGGGFLLIGYQEDESKILTPDLARPKSMEPYLTDAMNAIIKRRAEPPFHVEVTLQPHPVTKEYYPLVRVTGESKVPIRSDSGTPGGSLRPHVYYIRAPGPESRAPVNANEWDALLKRTIKKQREEIVSLLRSVMPNSSEIIGTNTANQQADLHNFAESCTNRWSTLNDALPENHPAKVTQGYFSFAAQVIGTSKNLSAAQIREINQSARKYTGWPAFVSLHHEPSRPNLVEGGFLEAWLANTPSPDVGLADFWRIDPKGKFFLLRGYQEDSRGIDARLGTPGQSFEVTLPTWRLGEFLLRVADLADAMFEEGYEVLVECTWTGLSGRSLFSHNGRRFMFGGHTSAASSANSTGKFSQQMLRELLPEVVKSLTNPLYEHFNFFTPPDSFYSEELAEMTRNRY
ncbi:MAG: helix-turn-helix domain-containing protein [Pseudomonadales bacterium]